MARWLIALFLASLCLADPLVPSQSNPVTSFVSNTIDRLKQRVFGSLLEQCRAGFPRFVEIAATIPPENREAGEPCATDDECRQGLTCECQATGGKECTAPSTVPPCADNYVKYTQGDGPASLYYLYGVVNGVFLHVDPSNAWGVSAPADSPPATATKVLVIPVGAISSDCLPYNTSFYLRTADGQYVERFARISSETPSDAPHYSPRFNLGLHNSPTQTWQVTRSDDPQSPYVEKKIQEGLEVGGTSPDWLQPDNNIRRMLTLRSDVSVVVWWWQSDEKIWFIPVQI